MYERKDIPSLDGLERGRMVKCVGCGFNVEHEQVVEWGDEASCPRPCRRCSAHCTPDVRESYRRGFNEGYFS